MKKPKTKLYATIRDSEGGDERVILVPFENADGDEVYVEEEERHNEKMLHILADEGYVFSNYYYPIRRYSIVSLEVYE